MGYNLCSKQREKFAPPPELLHLETVHNNVLRFALPEPSFLELCPLQPPPFPLLRFLFSSGQLRRRRNRLKVVNMNERPGAAGTPGAILKNCICSSRKGCLWRACYCIWQDQFAVLTVLKNMLLQRCHVLLPVLEVTPTEVQNTVVLFQKLRRLHPRILWHRW